MRHLTISRVVALVAVATAVIASGVALGAPSAGTKHPGPHGCVNSPGVLQRNKENVVDYYETAFNDKNPELAVKRYGGSEYIQHNPLAANGFDAFIAFVNNFTTAFPDVHIDIRRVIAECDMVVTHSVATGAVPVYGKFGSKVVDIFRLDNRGKVVEHWDVLAQQVDPATSQNGNPEV
jgi:predicted SnoaL-like aldol condensation-catalyzing enzyme